jgi:hypothetical protein
MKWGSAASGSPSELRSRPRSSSCQHPLRLVEPSLQPERPRDLRLQLGPLDRVGHALGHPAERGFAGDWVREVPERVERCLLHRHGDILAGGHAFWQAGLRSTGAAAGDGGAP